MEDSRDTSKIRIVSLLVFAGIIGIYLLLWSPWWYPASDSALYITVARNLDQGRGYTYMGQPHRQVPPLTPMLLWAGMQVSHSFGMANAIMIAFMIGGLAFMYLTLRQWLDYKVALALTAASALTYWQFRLATILGSDQPFLLFFWMALFCFARAYCQEDASRRALLWTAASGLLLLGLGFRIASFLFVPMVAAALWMEYRRQIPRLLIRLIWIGAVVTPFVLAAGTYWYWGKQAKGPRAPRELVAVPALALNGGDKTSAFQEGGFMEMDSLGGEPTTISASGKGITGYRLKPRLGVADIPKFPGLVGRWIMELFFVPSRQVFQKLSEGWQGLLGLPITFLAILGLIDQARRRKWWMVAPMLYVMMIAYMWGFRVIPRYLTPVLPMILLWISIGAGQSCAWLAGRARSAPQRRNRIARVVALAVPILVIVANMPVLAVELYARHTSDFYNTTRQGAWREIVDAASHIRTQYPQDTLVCTNDPMLRREIHLMTGRPIAATGLPFPIRDAQDEARIKSFFKQTGATVAVIRFFGNGWPEWHLGAIGAATDRAWWGLYIWDAATNQPVRVPLKADRDWIRDLPDSAI